MLWRSSSEGRERGSTTALLDPEGPSRTTCRSPTPRGAPRPGGAASRSCAAEDHSSRSGKDGLLEKKKFKTRPDTHPPSCWNISQTYFEHVRSCSLSYSTTSSLLLSLSRAYETLIKHASASWEDGLGQQIFMRRLSGRGLLAYPDGTFKLTSEANSALSMWGMERGIRAQQCTGKCHNFFFPSKV